MINLITITDDYSTDRVIDWLVAFKYDPARYNTDVVAISEMPILYSSVEKTNVSAWFRKVSSASPSFATFKFNNYLSKEVNAFWTEYLSSKVCEVLGSLDIEEPLNINMLQLADKNGLRSPRSIVTTSRCELIKFLEFYKSVICKPLIAPLNFIHDGVDYAFRTALIEMNDVLELDDFFYPTYFQQAIKRDYEVRLFYLKGRMWAMAFIVSKKNEISPDIWSIKKRREVPISVPKQIQDKVVGFMTDSDYNTGSLDFIISEGEWYFLELNPSGQYDFVSKSCNYFLDREIAKTLINE